MPRQLLGALNSRSRVNLNHSADARNSKSSENVLRLRPKDWLLSRRVSQIGAFFPAWVVMNKKTKHEKRVCGIWGIVVNREAAVPKTSVLKASRWPLNYTEHCDDARSRSVFEIGTLSATTFQRLAAAMVACR